MSSSSSAGASASAFASLLSASFSSRSRSRSSFFLSFFFFFKPPKRSAESCCCSGTSAGAAEAAFWRVSASDMVVIPLLCGGGGAERVMAVEMVESRCRCGCGWQSKAESSRVFSDALRCVLCRSAALPLHSTAGCLAVGCWLLAAGCGVGFAPFLLKCHNHSHETISGGGRKVEFVIDWGNL